MAGDLLLLERMRIVRVFVGIFACALAATAQSFPQAVDLVQRIDQLYPWLVVTAFDVDAQGNIYLTGSAKGPIPDILTSHLGPLGSSDIVVIKLDPSGQRVLYAVAIGGSGDDQAGVIRVDARGNAYLIAYPGSTDFPIVFRQGSGNGGPIVLKLNSTGSLTYSTSLSWALTIYGFGVDAAGTVYLGGTAIRGELPTSSTSYLASPPDSLVSGFVAKLNSSGQTLDAATYIFGAVSNLSPQANGSVVFSQDGVGALDSSLSHLIFLIDPGIETLSTGSPPLLDLGQDDAGNIYVAGQNALRKYGPDGQQLISLDWPTAIFSQFAVTHSGLVYLFGLVPPNFPTLNATQPCAPDLPNSMPRTSADGTWFLMVIGPDGETRYATYMGEQIDLMSGLSGSNGPYALAETELTPDFSPWKGILKLNADEIPSDHTSAACLAHAGTLQATQIAPGTIMALFGYRLGPDTGTSSVAESGVFPFNVAGTTLTVDGKPAPILYAQNSQINFIAPWSLRTDGAMVPVCVTAGIDTSCLYAPTYAVAPGFFAVNNTIAAINPDGTINSLQHPAPSGSYVSVYMTGGGQIQGPMVDGGLAGFDLQRILAAGAVVFTGSLCEPFGGCSDIPLDAQILFDGAVPTLVYGVEVVVVEVPHFDNPLGTQKAKFTLSLRATPDGPVSTASGFLYIR